jgi:hypothetical protein
VLLAALLQGSFVLPMTLVRQWSWEHTWATFSLLGMLVFNWVITVLFIPNIFAVYAASPARDLMLLALFGLAGEWGPSCSAWEWTGSAWPWDIPSSWALSPA